MNAMSTTYILIHCLISEFFINFAFNGAPLIPKDYITRRDLHSIRSLQDSYGHYDPEISYA